MVGFFILMIILGILPGIVYLIYYYMKDLECPICKKKNWGDETEAKVIEREERMIRAMNVDVEYAEGDIVCEQCLQKQDKCPCDAGAKYKKLTETQAKRMNDAYND